MINDWGKPTEIFLIFFVGSVGEATELQHQKIRLYIVNACKCVFIESLYVQFICLSVSMFRCALCHLGEHELQWFNPGSPLTGGVCCGICCVQRALVSNPAWTAPHSLPWACRSRGRGAPGWGGPCCVSSGVKDAGGWVGVSGWQAGSGVSSVSIVGCRLGMGVLGSWAEQWVGFHLVLGPCRGPSQQLAAAAQLTRLLFGKAVGGWVLEITLYTFISLLLFIHVLPVPISGRFLQLQRSEFFPLN